MGRLAGRLSAACSRRRASLHGIGQLWHLPLTSPWSSRHADSWSCAAGPRRWSPPDHANAVDAQFDVTDRARIGLALWSALAVTWHTGAACWMQALEVFEQAIEAARVAGDSRRRNTRLPGAAGGTGGRSWALGRRCPWRTGPGLRTLAAVRRTRRRPRPGEGMASDALRPLDARTAGRGRATMRAAGRLLPAGR